MTRIEFAEQMASQIPYIRNFDGRRGQQLPLDGQIVVGVVGDEERWSSRHSQRVGTIRNGVLTGWAVEGSVVDGRSLQQRRILECVLLPDAIQQAVIENSKAATDGR